MLATPEGRKRELETLQAWSVLCQGQARLIEEAAAAWGVEKDEPARQELVEELAAAVVRLAELLERWQKALWHMLFAGQVRTTQQTGRFFLDCVHASGKACRVVLDCLEAAPAGNGLTGTVDQVAEVRTRLGKMEQDFSRRWPFLDVATLQQGQGQSERGEVLSIEDICRDLQG